jgi:hypothetical protein
MQRIVSGDFLPARALVPTLPERLDQLVVRAMACDRNQRFQATRDFGHALLEFGSERTRAMVAHELGEGPRPSLSSAPRDSSAPAISNPLTPLATATTLGQSVHNLDSQPRQRSKRSPATLVGSSLVALAVAAGWFALGDKHLEGNDVSTRGGVATTAAPAPPAVNVEPQPVVRTIISEPSGASLERLAQSGAPSRPLPVAALPLRPELAPR